MYFFYKNNTYVGLFFSEVSQFDVAKMRNHFILCLEQKNLLPLFFRWNFYWFCSFCVEKKSHKLHHFLTQIIKPGFFLLFMGWFSFLKFVWTYLFGCRNPFENLLTILSDGEYQLFWCKNLSVDALGIRITESLECLITYNQNLLLSHCIY